jgi:5' nucleotidase, deoxy (Pyrimidine), cytosolic type C protein (NT5C)
MARTITEINVDLDGVMVNFIDRAIEVAGYVPDSVAGRPDEKVLKRDFWKAIERHVKAGNKFFETMEPMADAFVLWEYLGSIDVPKVICTATGHIIGAAEEKRAWVRARLGNEIANSARIVRDGKDKAKYASPTVVLIDDRMKVIKPWVDAGGIGIFHTSAESTITQLKEMGL